MNHLALKELKEKFHEEYCMKNPSTDAITCAIKLVGSSDWWIKEIAAREERLVEEIEKILWDWPKEIVTTIDEAKKSEYREYLKTKIIELIQK